MDTATKILMALASFSSFTRLYELTFKDETISTSGLLVEAFLAVEEVKGVGARDVIVLSTMPGVRLHHAPQVPVRPDSYQFSLESKDKIE